MKLDPWRLDAGAWMQRQRLLWSCATGGCTETTVCIHIYIYTCIHTQAYTYIHTVHSNRHRCMHVHALHEAEKRSPPPHDSIAGKRFIFQCANYRTACADQKSKANGTPHARCYDSVPRTHASRPCTARVRRFCLCKTKHRWLYILYCGSCIFTKSLHYQRKLQQLQRKLQQRKLSKPPFLPLAKAAGSC